MKALWFALIVAALMAPARATLISFTGAELVGLPGASLPSGGGTVIGDDLRFDLPRSFGVLYRLELADFISDPNEIGISVNYTRLLNDANGIDQDLFIGIYDGQTIFSVASGDGATTDISVVTTLANLASSGLAATNVSLLEGGVITPAPIGSVAQLDILIRANPTSTDIIGEVNSSGPTATQVSNIFNVNGNLSLLIFGDDDLGENYLINSLTLTNGAAAPADIPEPGTLAGLGLGILSIAGLIRRRKTI